MKSIIVLAAASLVCLTLLPQDASAQRRIGYRAGNVGVRAAVVGVRSPLVYRSYAAYRPYVRARYGYARPYYRAAAYRPYYSSYAAYRPVYSSYRPIYSELRVLPSLLRLQQRLLQLCFISARLQLQLSSRCGPRKDLHDLPERFPLVLDVLLTTRDA